MNNSKLYKKIFVDADIRDFIWRRNLELRLEVERIMKEYKKIKKNEKSNLNQVKKLGLVDKNGVPWKKSV